MPEWMYCATDSPAEITKADVRIAGLVERRRHADDRCVAVSERRVIGRCPEHAVGRRRSFDRLVGLGDDPAHPLRRNVLDVGLAAVQRFYLASIHVDPDHRKTALCKGHRQR